MEEKVNRIAAYYRVSTDKQDLASQKIVVEKWLAEQQQKEKIKVTTFEDNGFSGKNTRRAGYRELMKRLENEEFDTLVVFSLDRISRSAFDAISTHLKLDQWGVCLVSVTQEVMNLKRDHPFRAAILAMFACMAQLERDMLSKRTKAGLAKARKNGKILGRKQKGTVEQLATIKTMRAEGASYKNIAEAVGLSVPKVFYYLNPDKDKKRAS